MIAFFTMTMLQTLGCHRPDGLIEAPRDDAATAFEIEYAHRAGYRLGPNGEIADDRSYGNVVEASEVKKETHPLLASTRC